MAAGDEFLVEGVACDLLFGGSRFAPMVDDIDEVLSGVVGAAGRPVGEGQDAGWERPRLD